MILLVICCLLFHFLLDETLAETIEDMFYSFFEDGFECYVKDMFIGGVITKFLGNIDMEEFSRTLDSLVKFDIKESTMLLEDDEGSHF